MELYGPTLFKTVIKFTICHQVIGKFPNNMFKKCLRTMEPSYLSLINCLWVKHFENPAKINLTYKIRVLE